MSIELNENKENKAQTTTKMPYNCGNTQSDDVVHNSIKIKNSIEIKVTNRMQKRTAKCRQLNALLFYVSIRLMSSRVICEVKKKCQQFPRLAWNYRKTENESQSKWLSENKHQKIYGKWNSMKHRKKRERDGGKPIQRGTESVSIKFVK